MTARILVAMLLVATAVSAQPKLVGIYTYSRASDAGFKDERLDSFRRELGKYASPLMELAYTRATARVTVQFLGQGSLTIELDSTGEAARHLWTPDDNAPRMWAIVRMPSPRPFSKEFSVIGSGGRDLSKLAKDIGDWLQLNSTLIREP